MADMCYECQFSDTGYFCRFMEHGVCTAVSCKWMAEFEGRETCKLLNGTMSSKKGVIIMTESIKWNRTKQLTKDQFCELTRTPEDWHIFKECDQIEFYECDYLGRTYWRCDTKDTLWMFTKVDDEIWFKIKDRYDHGPYWSEWHDWP